MSTEGTTIRGTVHASRNVVGDLQRYKMRRRRHGQLATGHWPLTTAVKSLRFRYERVKPLLSVTYNYFLTK